MGSDNKPLRFDLSKLRQNMSNKATFSQTRSIDQLQLVKFTKMNTGVQAVRGDPDF